MDCCLGLLPSRSSASTPRSLPSQAGTDPASQGAVRQARAACLLLPASYGASACPGHPWCLESWSKFHSSLVLGTKPRAALSLRNLAASFQTGRCPSCPTFLPKHRDPLLVAAACVRSEAESCFCLALLGSAKGRKQPAFDNRCCCCCQFPAAKWHLGCISVWTCAWVIRSWWLLCRRFRVSAAEPTRVLKAQASSERAADGQQRCCRYRCLPNHLQNRQDQPLCSPKRSGWNSQNLRAWKLRLATILLQRTAPRGPPGLCHEVCSPCQMPRALPPGSHPSWTRICSRPYAWAASGCDLPQRACCSPAAWDQCHEWKAAAQCC